MPDDMNYPEIPVRVNLPHRPEAISSQYIANLESEVERLRAALAAQLEAHNYAEVLEIARKALAGPYGR